MLQASQWSVGCAQKGPVCSHACDGTMDIQSALAEELHCGPAALGELDDMDVAGADGWIASAMQDGLQRDGTLRS